MFIPLTKVENLSEKTIFCSEVNGVAVAVSLIKGEYLAVENLCSHALATFDDGRIRGYFIVCPLHGAMFDMRSGEPAGPPARRPIKTFPTRVNEDGVLEIDLG